MISQYVEIEFTFISTELISVLIAELSEAGFEGFEERDDCLNAYILSSNYDEHSVRRISAQHGTSFTKNVIEDTNWNLLWESSFAAVVIDDISNGLPWVSIRANFHEPARNVTHDLIITPKMSFGTGHHATTYMMIGQMSQIDFKDKVVLDFGTGTGVLAILAEKLGARNIVAADIDDWSIENARENMLCNDCSSIDLRKAASAECHIQPDIILANINKNVILENFSALVKQLSPGGLLLLSGFLLQDENDILLASQAHHLQLLTTTYRHNWLCLKFSC